MDKTYQNGWNDEGRHDTAAPQHVGWLDKLNILQRNFNGWGDGFVPSPVRGC